MANMYPPEVRSDTKSSAEFKVFTLIKNDLSDDWSALHSVGLTVHRKKPWAEIDFVLIGPPGIFCLEVKGGRISREGGRYLYTNRENETTVKEQGPFEQVGPAAAALYRHLVDRNNQFRDIAVGYGVVTPDIKFTIQGPDVEPRVVFDERDLIRPFSAYMRRLTDYWHERLESQGKRPRTLSESERATTVNYLRGDFDMRPSLRSRISHVNEELLRLTSEQYHILDDLIENERVIIRGGAGSGKTLLAVEEARRRAGEGENVFLSCFNSNLGDDLRKAVSDVPGITAGHLHGFMAKQIAKAGLNNSLPAAQEDDLFQIFYPEVCLEALMSLDEMGSYEVLIIDEAQDLLLETYLDVFDALVKGGLREGNWRFFLDPYQDLFMGTSPSGLKRLAQAHPAKYGLSINCRNTAQVATMTRLISGVNVLETLKVSGPEVEIRWWKDHHHQRKEVSNSVNRLLGQRVDPKDIVIVGHRRLRNSGLKDGLINVPFDLTDASDVISGRRFIRYATIKSYKGLESDTVLIIDVDSLDDQQKLFDLYVAGTRARAYLEIFLHKDVEEQYNNMAREFGRSLMGVEGKE